MVCHSDVVRRSIYADDSIVGQPDHVLRGQCILSTGTGIVQPFALFRVCRTTFGGTIKSVLALISSVIFAYTNNGYLRDAYR